MYSVFSNVMVLQHDETKLYKMSTWQCAVGSNALGVTQLGCWEWMCPFLSAPSSGVMTWEGEDEWPRAPQVGV